MVFPNHYLFDDIQRVLYQSWNPLNVRNFIDSYHAYESYVPVIYDMLVNTVSKGDIVSYLAHVEKQITGGAVISSPNQNRIHATVDRLVWVYEQIVRYYHIPTSQQPIDVKA